MKIILGSASPRRREILDYFSLPYTIVSSQFDERKVSYNNDPKAYVEEIARNKAKALSHYEDACVITADTCVSIDNKVLGKPESEDEMRAMLQLLSGRWHSVWTSVCVQAKGMCLIDAEETKVRCNSLTPDEMHRYIRKLALLDKAGGYAIQKSGGIFVKSIVGCYYNVMGLPINTLQKLLQKVGIDLWDYLEKFE